MSSYQDGQSTGRALRLYNCLSPSGPLYPIFDDLISFVQKVDVKLFFYSYLCTLVYPIALLYKENAIISLKDVPVLESVLDLP